MSVDHTFAKPSQPACSRSSRVCICLPQRELLQLNVVSSIINAC